MSASTNIKHKESANIFTYLLIYTDDWRWLRNWCDFVLQICHLTSKIFAFASDISVRRCLLRNRQLLLTYVKINQSHQYNSKIFLHHDMVHVKEFVKPLYATKCVVALPLLLLCFGSTGQAPLLDIPPIFVQHAHLMWIVHIFHYDEWCCEMPNEVRRVVRRHFAHVIAELLEFRGIHFFQSDENLLQCQYGVVQRQFVGYTHFNWRNTMNLRKKKAISSSDAEQTLNNEIPFA